MSLVLVNHLLFRTDSCDPTLIFFQLFPNLNFKTWVVAYLPFFIIMVSGDHQCVFRLDGNVKYGFPRSILP